MQMHNYNNDSKWDSGATGWDALDLGSRTVTGCGGSNPFRPTIALDKCEYYWTLYLLRRILAMAEQTEWEV